MLSNIMKTTNFSATSSIIDESGVTHPVMYMAASASTDGINITKSIKDETLYKGHMAEVLADYSTFEEQVMGITTGLEVN